MFEKRETKVKRDEGKRKWKKTLKISDAGKLENKVWHLEQ